jgi:hypothetical protein
MLLKTSISIAKSLNPINYDSYVMSWGSCFAESMGEKFSYYKIPSTVNPFGILFHPLAIEKVLKRAAEEIPFTEKDIFYHNEKWHSFEVHSCVSHSDKDVFLNHLNQILAETKSQLLKTTHFIITYGTAWVYRLKETQQCVSNCHKVPQNQFDKELLSIDILEKSIQKTIEFIQSVNPEIQIIFTISPVRHLKDGFVENQRSKAHLISAVGNQLSALGFGQSAKTQNLTPKTQNPATYFPSYEILLDELRDYRFYDRDLIHPNGLAVDYIWDKFKNSNIDSAAQIILNEVEQIQKMLAHKPFNELSDGYQKHLQKMTQKISQLQLQVPNIKF